MPVRPARLTAATAAVVVALGLAACGGDDPSTADSRDATASPSASARSDSDARADADADADARAGTGASTPPPAGSSADSRLTGEGYSFALPEGWRDATDQFKEYSELIDGGAVNADEVGEPFTDNVNVVRNADQTQLPPAQAEEQFTAELRTVASRVRVRPPARVDGLEALHLTGRTDAGGVIAVTDQYIVFVAGAYYVVTFSYDEGTPRAQREQEVAAVLDSWSWG